MGTRHARLTCMSLGVMCVLLMSLLVGCGGQPDSREELKTLRPLKILAEPPNSTQIGRGEFAGRSYDPVALEIPTTIELVYASSSGVEDLRVHYEEALEGFRVIANGVPTNRSTSFLAQRSNPPVRVQIDINAKKALVRQLLPSSLSPPPRGSRAYVTVTVDNGR